MYQLASPWVRRGSPLSPVLRIPIFFFGVSGILAGVATSLVADLTFLLPYMLHLFSQGGADPIDVHGIWIATWTHGPSSIVASVDEAVPSIS